MLDQKKAILLFARAIKATFTSSEWTELGYLTGTDEWIDIHPRLLRSLSWGDDDYKGHVFDAVKHILEKDEGNATILLQYEPVARWIEQNDPAMGAALHAELSGGEVAHVELQTSTDAGLAALADAQALLRTRGPSSAVDRVHTGLHAFLKAACNTTNITYASDASANALLKLLLEQHPQLADLGPRSDDIRRMIRTSASMVDALGTLRNQASLAHPNEEVLGHDEALLVINLTRSLLRFLDAKISGKTDE
jgi:hypothetical protein